MKKYTTLQNLETKIPIFLASDENYAPFLCCTMYSVLQNTKSFIEFNILDGGISKQSKNDIMNSLKSFSNFSLTYHDMKKFNLDKFPDLFHLTTNAYSRFFIPELVPNKTKVLYIDTDIIVKKDVKELYMIDLENYAIGAVLAPSETSGTFFKTNVYPNFKDVHSYFNSGVLLIDIQNFIKNDYTKALIDTCIKYKDKIQFADQDVFNILFEDKFKKLDWKYNFTPVNLDTYTNKYKKSSKTIIEEAFLLHYVGCGHKPWQNKKIATANEFWSIAKKTKFNKRITTSYKNCKPKDYTVLEHVFSVKNQKQHKVISTFGIKIKFRRKKMAPPQNTPNYWDLISSNTLDNKFPIRLSDNERSFLLKHITGATNYLEFGSGGSTFLALENTNIPNITSIETDSLWIEYLKKWNEIYSQIGKRLNIIHVDIGKTGEWGVPIEESKRKDFPNFSQKPFLDNIKYDRVFIDGRFRVACALQTILNCDNNTKILIHDFNNRSEYHCILEFLEIVDTADMMALFKLKENIDTSKVLEMYNEYKFIYQ